MRNGDALYVGHLGNFGVATSNLDVSDVSAPRLVRQLPAPPGTHCYKVQVAGGLLLVNEEQYKGGDPFAAGMIVYDVSDPFEPKRIGHFDSGGLGVHRIVYRGGRFAYVSAVPEGFDSRIWVVVDLADPEHPVEVRSYHAESVLHGAITGEVEYSEAMVLFFDAAYDGPRTRRADPRSWGTGYLRRRAT